MPKVVHIDNNALIAHIHAGGLSKEFAFENKVADSTIRRRIAALGFRHVYISAEEQAHLKHRRAYSGTPQT